MAVALGRSSRKSPRLFMTSAVARVGPRSSQKVKVALLPAFEPFGWSDGIGLAAAYVLWAAGYYSVTHAMRIGEAAVVAPYRYTRMVFVLTLAVVFLNERPGFWVLGGATLIILTGLYALARTRNAAATLQPSPVPGDGI